MLNKKRFDVFLQRFRFFSFWIFLFGLFLWVLLLPSWEVFLHLSIRWLKHLSNCLFASAAGNSTSTTGLCANFRHIRAWCEKQINSLMNLSGSNQRSGSSCILKLGQDTCLTMPSVHPVYFEAVIIWKLRTARLWIMMQSCINWRYEEIKHVSCLPRVLGVHFAVLTWDM